MNSTPDFQTLKDYIVMQERTVKTNQDALKRSKANLADMKRRLAKLEKKYK
jgi:hypothetical protein